MPTYVPPKINTAWVGYVSLVSQANTKVFQASPTLAAGDVKVAVDDAAPANVTDLPVVDADFTKRVKVTLTAAEMAGDNISIIFSDAAGAEWCDLTLNIQTSAVNLEDIEAQTDDIGAAGAGLTALASAADLSTLAAYVDTEVAAIKTKTDNLTFTVANVLDANVQRINDVPITGDGSGTPFGV